jgi:triacylglycerol esterase/lipase EstA (alpha/beta hydrolase family)
VLNSLSPARRRFVAGTAGLVVLVAAVVGGTAAVRARQGRGPDVTPVAQDAQPPVLLVPGYGGATDDLEPLAAALRAQGRDATIVDLAGDGTGDLHLQAGVLQTAVEAALRGGARSVDIIGYSAGGVTARLWVQTYDGGSVARRIVTLGSPQHGSDLASLASDIAPDSCPEACRQLATDSDLVRSLNSGDETPEGPRWVSIWTTDDQVSVPPETAVLDGALDFSVQSICPSRRVTHGQLPDDPAVMAMVLTELRRTPPAVPPTSVCTASRLSP